MEINGHKTSISLEDEFWFELKAIATERRLPLSALVGRVDRSREPGRNLCSALRVFFLRSCKEAHDKV